MESSCIDTSIDLRQIVLRKERYAEQRNARVLWCCNFGLDAEWWTVALNVAVIFDMFSTSWKMGEHQDLENHGNDQ